MKIKALFQKIIPRKKTKKTRQSNYMTQKNSLFHFMSFVIKNGLVLLIRFLKKPVE